MMEKRMASIRPMINLSVMNWRPNGLSFKYLIIRKKESAVDNVIVR